MIRPWIIIFSSVANVAKAPEDHLGFYGYQLLLRTVVLLENRDAGCIEELYFLQTWLLKFRGFKPV